MNHKQLILVMETDKHSKSDYMYLRSFIDHFFLIDQHTKICPVYLNGKRNYNNAGIIKIIKKEQKLFYDSFSDGLSHVVYCYDTDDLDFNQDDQNFDKQISEFCESNGYFLVFFCRDIEEVFSGSRINKSDKRKTAESFYRGGKIKNIIIDKFKSEKKRKTYSNLYLVLAKLLPEKNNSEDTWLRKK